MSEPAQRKSFWAALGEAPTLLSVVILYCAVEFLGRVLLSPNVNGAEASQILFGQSFQWGYRPGQPPLAAWLSWAVLSISHDSSLPLFLLRDILLGVGLLGAYAAARSLLANPRNATFTTLFLMATFAVGWLLQTSPLETVLLATLCNLYLWAELRMLKNRALVDYVILGCVAGLGASSSYIFLILPVALTVAVALTPELRVRARLMPSILAAVIATAIVLPYLVLGPAVIVTGQPAARSPMLGALQDFVVAIGVFALPALLVFAALYPKAFRPLVDASDLRWARFLAISMTAGAVVSLVALFLFHARDPAALAYPVLLPLPIFLFRRAERADPERRERDDKLFAAAVLACVVLGLGVRAVMYHSRAHDCRHCAEYWPMTRFADTFRQAGFYGGTIAAPDAALAGNLKLQFPDSRAVTPDAPPLSFGSPMPGPCLVVWQGEGSLPARLRDYMVQGYGARLQERAMQGDIEATLLTGTTRKARMNFLILADGSCARPRG